MKEKRKRENLPPHTYYPCSFCHFLFFSCYAHALFVRFCHPLFIDLYYQLLLEVMITKDGNGLELELQLQQADNDDDQARATPTFTAMQARASADFAATVTGRGGQR
jgi:hypothetical protein